ncbi:MAG: tRNA (adenosine(37)-N6)-threonylcarbamoyltransferase complex ATPase subunit type 1 TsaE [Saprospiraceae bacterium]|nr:tRNA (adenosine(37)-N6)-threonylcarbamoyltransferase complex ATPase subunit type 1 TsaE [Saprospiraceae bacterium]
MISEKDLPQVARTLLERAGQSRVFTLSGDLGAGKTTLIRTVCSLLGVPASEINSPTYGLVNEYVGDTKIYHLDLYRLNRLEEALDIGIEDILYSGYFCFIEWPELIEPVLPDDTVTIKLEIPQETTRKTIF